MPSVFLSHSSSDKPFIRTLADHLKQDPQLQVWLDEREIPFGANIPFKSWEKDWRSCEPDLPDFQLALAWALTNDASFTERLAFYGSALTRRVGRLSESVETCQIMIRKAGNHEDKDAEQAWLRNQALVLKAWGRLEEALALHKKEEAICLELGNKDGLQRSYGNQALILQVWGQPEEALALHKKKEALCLELGNKADLGYCYYNWGLLARARKRSAYRAKQTESRSGPFYRT